MNPYGTSQQQPQQQLTNNVTLVETPYPIQTNSSIAAIGAINDVSTDNLVDENGKLRFKKIFGTRKKASVRAREKKVRQNRRLRKAIVPKNALMALNEVKGLAIGDFIINNNVGGGFTASVTVNNNQYEGKGQSKIAAKNSACEKALREYVITKMRQNPRKRNSAGEPMDTESDVGDDSQKSLDEDEVPMLNLASFALYKLFSEWEKDGFSIPEMHPAVGNANFSDFGSQTPKEPKAPPIRNELPADWEQQHPTTLLCLMRPGIAYIDKGTIGEKPNVLQKLEVTVDGVQYSGCGRNKKIARRNCAVTVCNTLFNTNFIKEEPCA